MTDSSSSVTSCYVEGKLQSYATGSAKKVFTATPLLQGKIFERARLKTANMPLIWD